MDIPKLWLVQSKNFYQENEIFVSIEDIRIISFIEPERLHITYSNKETADIIETPESFFAKVKSLYKLELDTELNTSSLFRLGRRKLNSQ